MWFSVNCWVKVSSIRSYLVLRSFPTVGNWVKRQLGKFAWAAGCSSSLGRCTSRLPAEQWCHFAAFSYFCNRVALLEYVGIFLNGTAYQFESPVSLCFVLASFVPYHHRLHRLKALCKCVLTVFCDFFIRSMTSLAVWLYDMKARYHFGQVRSIQNSCLYRRPGRFSASFDHVRILWLRLLTAYVSLCIYIGTNLSLHVPRARMVLGFLCC